jgi:NAD(P)-dependent dehydrogenase (short-subunit alcohol dehydrogenase family)
MTGRVAGKVALVTGAASGLGLATARLLAREGARVALTDIDEAGVVAAAAAIGENALALRHDVTDEARWPAVLDETVARFGALHILVNNAGIADSGTVEETTLEQWRKVHAVDLDSVFFGCKHGIARIAASGGGSIVNISSIAGIVAGHNVAAYNSAKAAVRHLTKSVALHCARRGTNIRCNSVHPAFTDTPILDSLVGHLGKAEAHAKLARQIPLGRIGTPDDVAYGVLYLASDESRFMTGSELVLDGGISAM